MRISRIYYPNELAVDSQVTLTDDASNHLINVLRAKVDQDIVLFNGEIMQGVSLIFVP